MHSPVIQSSNMHNTLLGFLVNSRAYVVHVGEMGYQDLSAPIKYFYSTRAANSWYSPLVFHSNNSLLFQREDAISCFSPFDLFILLFFFCLDLSTIKNCKSSKILTLAIRDFVNWYRSVLTSGHIYKVKPWYSPWTRVKATMEVFNAYDNYMYNNSELNFANVCIESLQYVLSPYDGFTCIPCIKIQLVTATRHTNSEYTDITYEGMLYFLTWIVLKW